MALAYSLLASDQDTTNTTTYADAESTQPAANSALLWFIYNHATPGAQPSSLSAYGLTWTQIATLTSGNGRLSVYEAYAGSSPSSSNATVTFAANQTGCNFSIIEITGADATDFTVQQPTNSGTATSGSVSLSAFGDAANNGCVAAFGILANEAMTPDTTATWTERADAGHNNPAARMAVETRTGEDTTASYSWTSNVAWAGVAVEIKVASSGESHSDGSTAEIDLDPQASCTLSIADGSEGEMALEADGAGVTAIADGDTALMELDAQAGSTMAVADSGTADVDLDAEGSGLPAMAGASTATVTIDAEGDGFGQEAVQDGSTAVLELVATGAGFATEVHAGGATTVIELRAYAQRIRYQGPFAGRPVIHPDTDRVVA